MLVLPNVTMEPSNVTKEIKEPPNVTKVQLHVMLILYNVRMVSSNVREKKKKELPNVTKVQSHFMLIPHHNMMMIPSNVMFW